MPSLFVSRQEFEQVEARLLQAEKELQVQAHKMSELQAQLQQLLPAAQPSLQRGYQTTPVSHGCGDSQCAQSQLFHRHFLCPGRIYYSTRFGRAMHRGTAIANTRSAKSGDHAGSS
eukprot:symbB.v1.2.013705.t1/scaffold974.1/size359025/12